MVLSHGTGVRFPVPLPFQLTQRGSVLSGFRKVAQERASRAVDDDATARRVDLPGLRDRRNRPTFDQHVPMLVHVDPVEQRHVTKERLLGLVSLTRDRGEVRRAARGETDGDDDGAAAMRVGDDEIVAAWSDRLANRRRGAYQTARQLAAWRRLRPVWTPRTAADWLTVQASVKVWEELVVDLGYSPRRFVAIMTRAATEALLTPRP